MAELQARDGRAETRPRTRPKDRKLQILNAARALFVERGYHNVSMSMIASAVDIGASALYRHFPNKAVLLEEVVKASFAEVELPDPAADSLTETLAAASAMAAGRPHLGALWSREARYLDDSVREEIRGMIRRSGSAYAELLRVARPELSFRQADLLAWALQSTLSSSSQTSVRAYGRRLPGLLNAVAIAISEARLVPEGEALPAFQGGRSPASTRERLLLAAMRLFAERGYQDTSMAEIGAEAAVTGPNLYGYFANKEALLIAAVERGTHALWLDLDAALTRHARPEDALRDVIPGYVRVSAGWSMTEVQVSGAGEAIRLAKEYEHEYTHEWIQLLRAARPDLDDRAARALVSICLVLIEQLCRTPHLTGVSGFEANVSAVAWAVLLADLSLL